LGVDVLLNSCPASIDFSPQPSIILPDGSILTADLIIGADGLKSKTREILLGRSDPPALTGDLAYRILINVSKMRDDPLLLDIFEKPYFNVWIGPDAHAVCYLLKGGEVCNIVLCCPDNLPPDVNVSLASPDELTNFFSSWDPRLQRLLSLSHTVYKWRLQNIKEMKTWLHPSGRFTLIGDACHATLPYLSQGAAMAVEDAAVLGELLGRIDSKEQLPDVLALFEALRKPRTTAVVNLSTHNRDAVFHLPDGIEQKERDRKLLKDDVQPGFPNKWRDPQMRDFLFKYDAFSEAEEGWERFQLEGRFWEKKMTRIRKPWTADCNLSRKQMRKSSALYIRLFFFVCL
jgi:salicylate hydroxylase